MFRDTDKSREGYGPWCSKTNTSTIKIQAFLSSLRRRLEVPSGGGNKSEGSLNKLYGRLVRRKVSDTDTGPSNFSNTLSRNELKNGRGFPKRRAKCRSKEGKVKAVKVKVL